MKKLEGGKKFEGKQPGLVTEKQLNILRALRYFYGEGVIPYCTNSKDAYAVISKYSDVIRWKEGNLYIEGQLVVKDGNFVNKKSK